MCGRSARPRAARASRFNASLPRPPLGGHCAAASGQHQPPPTAGGKTGQAKARCMGVRSGMLHGHWLGGPYPTGIGPGRMTSRFIAMPPCPVALQHAPFKKNCGSSPCFVHSCHAGAMGSVCKMCGKRVQNVCCSHSLRCAGIGTWVLLRSSSRVLMPLLGDGEQRRVASGRPRHVSTCGFTLRPFWHIGFLCACASSTTVHGEGLSSVCKCTMLAACTERVGLGADGHPTRSVTP